MATYVITGVQHQSQLNPAACWYTCLQMVVRYYEETSMVCLGDLSGPENFPHMQSRYSASRHPSWREWREWAEQCGFTPLNLTPNINGIYNYLVTYGPIIYSGTWGNTFDGHVVVITGANTSTGTLYVDDPLERSAPVTKNITNYFARLTQRLWENPLFVY